MTPKQLRDFILWCREERISFTHITAGGITLDGVVDGKADAPPPAKPEPRPTAFQRYGGDMLTQPSAKKSDLIPDEALDD